MDETSIIGAQSGGPFPLIDTGPANGAPERAISRSHSAPHCHRAATPVRAGIPIARWDHL